MANEQLSTGQIASLLGDGIGITAKYMEHIGVEPDQQIKAAKMFSPTKVAIIMRTIAEKALAAAEDAETGTLKPTRPAPSPSVPPKRKAAAPAPAPAVDDDEEL